MKTRKLVFLPVCLLALTGCPSNSAKKLSTPELSVNSERNGLTWAAVEGAASYSISVNDEAAVSVNEPGYSFAETAGQYAVKVVAMSGDKKSKSDAAEFNYSTAYAMLGDLSVSNGVISWSAFAGTSLQYSVDGGEPVAVSGNSVTATVGGLYEFTALGGFEDATNKYYVQTGYAQFKKSLLVQPAQSEAVILESGEHDGNAELQELYEAKKYGETGGWVDTSATIVLDEDNPFSTGKCVKANIWHHGAWFKWTRALEGVNGRIESLHFFLKADTAMRFALSFEITEDLVVAGLNLKNVYATYILQPAPTQWTEYTISTDDANWKVNYGGQLYPFATVQGLLAGAGYNVQSIGDFFPFFGNYSIKAFGEYQDGGPTCRLWFDDISLGVTPTQTIVDKKVAILPGEFAFKTNMINAGLFTLYSSTSGKINFMQGPNKEDVPVIVAIAENNRSMTLTSTKNGFEFVATLITEDGENFTLGSVSGTITSFLMGLQAEKCEALYDFEDFTATGQGYDNNHTDASQRTGLRAEFFSDFYDGGNAGRVQSIIGGNGWSLMGSSDYLDLSTTYAHTGAKSMKLKYNKDNQMRFVTYNLADGSGAAYAPGSYLSMWVRACASRDNDIKLKAFYINQVTPSTQSSCDEVEVVIPADSNNGWVEVRLELKSNRTYYGFGIQPMKNSGGTSGDGQYFFVDDIAVFSSINPYYNAAE